MFIPLLIFHIGAGATALLSGTVALSFRKGSRSHARAGTLFFGAMLAMATSGLAMAAAKGEPETAAVAVLTIYLVVTSWRTARYRDGRVRDFDRLVLVVPIALTFVLLFLARDAVIHPRPEVPPQGLFIFAGLAALPAALDLNFILHGQLRGAQRITRHLWRMCTAMLFAAFSFFQGQAHVFPNPIRHSLLLFVPTLGVLGTMIYWLAKIRLSKRLDDAFAALTKVRAAKN